MENKIELLAPAGDMTTFITAVKAGADAIYFGLQNFNMRARSPNFKLTDLPKMRRIADKHKINLYLTLNTIIYDNELTRLEKLIKKVKPYINAVICSDMSVMLLCKKYKIPFHVSTQVSVSNIESAKFYKKLGARRIVLARELSLKQIKSIAKHVNVEVFAHGAMCVSVSGRCFMSNHLYKNQSANRGRCIQPCRRFYHVKDDQGKELRVTNNHIFSAKDLCTLPFLEKLKKAGIKSIKLEGRSREPEYVDTVVRVYKHALNNKLTPAQIKQAITELNKVYTKGFSSGFYLGTPTNDDFSNAQHSTATRSKQFIGKITHYYKNLEVGLLHINTGQIKLGDNIMILGNTTGIKRFKIENMQINHKPVNIAKKAQDVGIKLPLCRKGDDLYKVIRKK
ncbi:U32 family peptidase [Candidatus Pacearchaeota archaeon]|nr:U32 family peptidase [Candidatus Pacearchaeota archaeon]